MSQVGGRFRILLVLGVSAQLLLASVAAAQSPPNVTSRDVRSAAKWARGKVKGAVKRVRVRAHKRSQARQQRKMVMKEFKTLINGNKTLKKHYFKRQLDLRTPQAGFHKVMSAVAATPAIAYGVAEGNKVALAVGAGMVALSAVEHVSQSRGNDRARVSTLRKAVRDGVKLPGSLVSHYGTRMKSDAAGDLQWNRDQLARLQQKEVKKKAKAATLKQRSGEAKNWLSKKVLTLRADSANKSARYANKRVVQRQQWVDQLKQEVATLQGMVK